MVYSSSTSLVSLLQAKLISSHRMYNESITQFSSLLLFCMLGHVNKGGESYDLFPEALTMPNLHLIYFLSQSISLSRCCCCSEYCSAPGTIQTQLPSKLLQNQSEVGGAQQRKAATLQNPIKKSVAMVLKPRLHQL